MAAFGIGEPLRVLHGCCFEKIGIHMQSEMPSQSPPAIAILGEFSAKFSLRSKEN